LRRLDGWRKVRATADEESGMKIISLNAWGGAVHDALVEWLPSCGADVLCLQEVTRTPGLGGWTSFDDGERSLSQRASLLADVQRALPRHQTMFLASDAGPITSPEGRRHRQDFGIAVVVDERFPVIAHDSLFVHGGFADHDEWVVDDRPRVAQGVRVFDRAADRAVAVVHLHGLRDRRGKGDTPARRAQADRLLELVTRLRERDELVVVCGDLNLLPCSDTFARLGSLGLVDLVGEADTRTSHYGKDVRHASYLLVSDPGAVRSFDVLAAPEVSDHRPLVLEV
jgi:endonuclease/exonuclease/phosphatase family metal-dependent hydrolase